MNHYIVNEYADVHLTYGAKKEPQHVKFVSVHEQLKRSGNVSPSESATLLIPKHQTSEQYLVCADICLQTIRKLPVLKLTVSIVHVL